MHERRKMERGKKGERVKVKEGAWIEGEENGEEKLKTVETNLK